MVTSNVLCRLEPSEIGRRARSLSLVLTDCDGVLTDAGVYYGHSGDELRKFSVRDGMGFALLREAGIACGIISGEGARSIAARADKLGIDEVHLGIREKGACLARVLERRALAPSACAYIGDDINDLPIFTALSEGITACPSDAAEPVLARVHVVLPVRGGEHAFRAFSDFILSHRS